MPTPGEQAWEEYTRLKFGEGRSGFVALMGACQKFKDAHPDEHWQSQHDAFLTVMDGMIEATIEFIADDGVMADHDRIHDLSALLRTRELYLSTFASEEDREAEERNQSQT